MAKATGGDHADRGDREDGSERPDRSERPPRGTRAERGTRAARAARGTRAAGRTRGTRARPGRGLGRGFGLDAAEASPAQLTLAVRPSRVARVARSAVLIGVDVGGTKVLAGEIDSAGKVGRTATRRTPGRRASVAALEDALTEAVLEAADGRPLAGVGLAAAGFVDAAAERVMFAPHLPWAGEPVRSRLAARWNAPVALDNDATCAAVAENELGAARGASSALVVTMGTGIGGAVVFEGAVWRGRQGMAGEFGHAQLVPDGRACECGQTGCWEQYSSGNALVRYARARIGVEPTVLTELAGGVPEQLTGPMVSAAAAAGDLVARQAFAEIGTWLGIGLAGLVAAFDAEVVVIGGGVSAAGDLLLDPAREALARRLVGTGHRLPPDVVVAALGPEAGMVGAALLAADSSDVASLWPATARRRRRRGRVARGAS